MEKKEISKFEIYQILHSRLKTHDRIVKINNKNIYYLPTLYWSLFKDYQRNYSNEILFEQIKKIVFHYEDGSKNLGVVFEKIDKFYTNKERELIIEVNKKEYFVKTPIKDKLNQNIAFEKLILSDDAFRIATIDHNPTFKSFIENYLQENESSFIQKLSLYINPKKSKQKKINKSLTDSIINYIKIEKISLDDIWIELENIAKFQKLEIVHVKYNFKE